MVAVRAVMLEDNPCLGPGGPAERNADLVENVVDPTRSPTGWGIATPAETASSSG